MELALNSIKCTAKKVTNFINLEFRWIFIVPKFRDKRLLLLQDSMTRRRSNDLVPSDHSPLVPRHNSDLLESHMISHQQFVGGTGRVGVAAVERGEEFQGITAGIGVLYI